jgi:nitroreductase
MTKSRNDPVPRKMIDAVIEACTWAPNHRKTEPWRFVVLTGTARERLGSVMAESMTARCAERGVEPDPVKIEKERAKPVRAPVLIAVAAVPNPDPRTVEVEEIAATAAGIQNMLLAAQSLGLGAMWRTGDAASDPAVKRFLGFPEHAHLLAFLYLGFPELVPPLSREPSSADKTVWLER